MTLDELIKAIGFEKENYKCEHIEDVTTIKTYLGYQGIEASEFAIEQMWCMYSETRGSCWLPVFSDEDFVIRQLIALAESVHNYKE